MVLWIQRFCSVKPILDWEILSCYGRWSDRNAYVSSWASDESLANQLNQLWSLFLLKSKECHSLFGLLNYLGPVCFSSSNHLWLELKVEAKLRSFRIHLFFKLLLSLIVILKIWRSSANKLVWLRQRQVLHHFSLFIPVYAKNWRICMLGIFHFCLFQCFVGSVHGALRSNAEIGFINFLRQRCEPSKITINCIR